MALASIDRLDDRVERQPRGLADDLQQLLRRADPRHLHQDPVRALALDRRLAGAGLVDAAADDLQALLQRPASSAAFCASVSVTTSWSPSVFTSNSRPLAPVSEKTGLAASWPP